MESQIELIKVLEMDDISPKAGDKKADGAPSPKNVNLPETAKLEENKKKNPTLMK